MYLGALAKRDKQLTSWLSDVMYQSGSPRADFVKFDSGNFHKNRSIKSKIDENRAKISSTTLRPKYVILLWAILNNHKNAVCKWNGIRLLEKPRI
jgi:hypothetical protein